MTHLFEHSGSVCCHRRQLHAPSEPAGAGDGPRPFPLSGDEHRFERGRPWDVRHLRLHVRLDVAAKAIDATAVLTVAARDARSRTLVLDAVALDVSSVERLDDATSERGTPLDFRNDGDHLHVSLDAEGGRTWHVAVRYRATPRRGLFFLGPDADHPSRPQQVWSQCQDEDARHWIPCHDAPNGRLTSEMIVDAPAEWTVLSNGVLVERVTLDGGRARTHWSQRSPHASYLLTLVAGRFSEIVADREGLPIRYYVDPGREDDARRSLGRTPEMIAHFESLTGVPFPWDKYAQVVVHDFTFGGMENTSATTLTDRALLDARAALDHTADDLVAHELAHQWFGDLVTCRDWSHAWLNEGFATFMEHVDAERREGTDGRAQSLHEHAEAYFSEDGERYRRPIVCHTYASPIDLFDRHLYEKGGWVLHMLREELGAPVFWAGVRRYLERHRGGLAETRDLARAMEEASGRPMDRFFRQWVEQGGHPEFETSYAFDGDAGLLRVTVKQTQTVDAMTPLFHVGLSVVVVDAHGEVAHRVDVDGASHTFLLPCARAPRRVLIDPDGAVLARWSNVIPRDHALDALRHDARPWVRWRAIDALTKRGEEPEVVGALARAVREDGFWGVAAAAARALGSLRGDAARDALLALTDVTHSKVRASVHGALGQHRHADTARAAVARLGSDEPSWKVLAASARAAGATRQAELVRTPLLAALQRESWRDLVRAGALDGLASLGDPGVVDAVLPWAAPSARLGSRRAAVQTLGRLGSRLPPERRVVLRESLEQWLDGGDPYFTPDCIEALVRLGDPAAASALERLAATAIDGRVRRHAREGVRDLRRADPGAEARRVSDTVDRLKDELAALRASLARLEATRTARSPASGTRAKPQAKSAAKSVGTSTAKRRPRR